MNAIQTKFTNRTLGAPTNWDEERDGECRALPVHMGAGFIYSWWRPTWRERLSLLLGLPIRLCVLGERMPPVAMEVAGDK